MRQRQLLLLAILPLLACDRAPASSSGAADTGLALATTARAKDSLIGLKDSLLADKERQLSVQSQMLGDAITSARLVAEIDRDLSKVRGLTASTTRDTLASESAIQTTAAEVARVQQKVTRLISRLNASEGRLRTLRRDSTAMASQSAELIVQVRQYELTIAELRGSLDQQRRELAVMAGRVDSLTNMTVALSARNDAMTRRTNALLAKEDTAYVAIGTQDELLAKGLIRKEGGTALMFGRGKTLVPGRDFDASAFQVISKNNDRTIQLPRSDKEYQIVSSQNLTYSDIGSVKDAKVRGALTISEPDKFWAPSRYLIFVQR